jgi:hypothetical protein
MHRVANQRRREAMEGEELRHDLENGRRRAGGRYMTPELLLAGVLCAVALNAITAWVRLGRAPATPPTPRVPSRALSRRILSASLQTLALPLVLLLLVADPHVFRDLLARTPSGELIFAVALPVLVLLMCWRLFVEFTRTLPVLRRQRAEAALGRRVLSRARRNRLQ